MEQSQSNSKLTLEQLQKSEVAKAEAVAQLASLEKEIEEHKVQISEYDQKLKIAVEDKANAVASLTENTKSENVHC